MEQENSDKSMVDSFLEQNAKVGQNSSDLGVQKFVSAPMGVRILAFLIDRIIIFFAGRILSIVGIFGDDAYLISIVFNGIIEFVYAGYFYQEHRATPGKMIFNLEVLTDSGQKLNFVQGGSRDAVGKFVSGIILCIGYLMAFFRSDNKALHDLLFKTNVVAKSEKPTIDAI